MTIKELYPLLTPLARRSLGKRFVSSYRARNEGQSPNRKEEDGYLVFDYPEEFITRVTKILNRVKKKYPENIFEKPKRKRITKGFAQLVNPDSTRELESKNKY